MILRCVIFALLFCLLGRPLQAGVSCGGIDDYLETGLALSTFVTASTFTAMTWIKVQGTTGEDGECYNRAPLLSDAGGFLALGQTTTNLLCGSIWDGSAKTLTAAPSAPWSHLALRLSGGSLELFVNGVTAGSLGATSIEDVSGFLYGCNPLSGSMSPDRLEDASFYQSAVPTAEIATIGQSRIAGMGRTAPAARWPFDGCPHGTAGNGVVFPDRSGNNRPMTGALGAIGLTCTGAEYVSRRWGIH